MATAEETKSDQTSEHIAVDPQKSEADAVAAGSSEDASAGTEKATFASTATSTASNAATSASNAGGGMKDSVFSMFGGGAKNEK